MYLKAHMYSNTASQDLWTSMSEASGVDVASLMDSWVTKVKGSFYAGFWTSLTRTVGGIPGHNRRRDLGRNSASPEPLLEQWRSDSR